MDPFTMIILASAALGANVAHNKDQNVLEGALKGAALGATGGALGGVAGAPALPFFATAPTTAAASPGALATTTTGGKLAASKALTGGFSAAADPITGVLAQQTGSGAAAALKADVASKAAASKAAIVPATNAASTVGVDSLFSPADLGLNVNPATGVSLNIPTDSFSAFQAQNAANKTALDSAVGKINITNPLTEKLPLSPGAKLLATAKDKPLETAFFASAVGSALSPPPVTGGGAAPPFNPGSVQPTPTVDETIGEMPMFIPKPLFDDMMGRSPEEMMLLEEQMMARGLV